MKKLLIIAMACYGLSARAQLRESRNFLYLYSDSIIHARDIKLRPDFSGNLRLRVNGKNFPMAQVKFLNSNDGFFANTRKMGIVRSTDFAERIIEGRINVFQERSLSYAPFVYDTHHGHQSHFVSSVTPSIDVSMYYNKGYDNLKRLNYRNLKQDMANNPESMDMLHAYRRGVNASNVLYSAAAASILAGFITFISDGKNARPGADAGSSRNFAIGAGLGLAGVGLGAAGYLKTISANKRLENAVDIYNQ